MPFEIFPALDVLRGRLAAFRGGQAETLGDMDPLEMARRYARAGASWIHFVDLQAAVEGRPGALDLLEAVASLPVKVQAGGGLSGEGVRAALERGATRAILGSAALGRPEEVREVVEALGPRVGIGLDVRGDVVAPRGTGTTGPPLEDALALLTAARPSFVVYTDVERDGAMAGPDPWALGRLADTLGVPVIASGGIRSLEDLRSLAAVPGVAGAIVGQALRAGTLSLEEALAELG